MFPSIVPPENLTEDPLIEFGSSTTWMRRWALSSLVISRFYIDKIPLPQYWTDNRQDFNGFRSFFFFTRCMWIMHETDHRKKCKFCVNTSDIFCEAANRFCRFTLLPCMNLLCSRLQILGPTLIHFNLLSQVKMQNIVNWRHCRPKIVCWLYHFCCLHACMRLFFN